ncbi:MAG: nucleoside recognition domain-containing protein [Desulfobaccales bacterium]
MQVINLLCQYLIPVFVLFTVVYGFVKKVRVYDSFVSGAKDGIGIITGIFPYVLAIFIVVKTFEASGAHDFLKRIFSIFSGPLHIPPEVFSIAIVKPFSNAASLGIFTEILKSTGADSLGSIAAAVIMGSAETTFYVLAVYLGSVGIKKTKYLVPVCIAADVAGIVIAITLIKLLF